MSTKVVVVGGTKRAFNTLKRLVREVDVDVAYAVFMSGNDDESEFGDELVRIAEAENIPYVLSENITSEIIEKTIAVKADAIIGIGVWRTKIPPDYLNATKFGYLGLHGSAVPAYRGFAAINWQIINGEPSLKMRALRLDADFDSGPCIADQDGRLLEYSIDLQNEKHLQEIFEEYEDIHIKSVLDTVRLVSSGTIRFIDQDQTDATYACHRGPEDAQIDWSETTEKVFNLIRSQSKPYKGTFTWFKGAPITIWRAKPRPDFANYVGRVPGKVVHRDRSSGSVIILTKDSGIEVLEATSGEKTVPFEIFNTVRVRCKSSVEAAADAWHAQWSSFRAG